MPELKPATRTGAITAHGRRSLGTGRVWKSALCFSVMLNSGQAQPQPVLGSALGPLTEHRDGLVPRLTRTVSDLHPLTRCFLLIFPAQIPFVFSSPQGWADEADLGSRVA